MRTRLKLTENNYTFFAGYTTQLPLTITSESHLHNHIRQTWQNLVLRLSNSKSTSHLHRAVGTFARDWTLSHVLICEQVHIHAIVSLRVRWSYLNTANIDRNNGNDGCGNVCVSVENWELTRGRRRKSFVCIEYSTRITYNVNNAVFNAFQRKE